jgi:hypothetical protein
MKKIILVVVIICMTPLQAAKALAAEVAWMYTQHREYGAGSTVNRLGFGLVDDQYHYLAGGAAVREVTLTDPGGMAVNLSPVKFGSVYEIYGTYDSKNSRWHYTKNWEFDSWFSSDISGLLTPGIYRLAVSTADGKIAERAFEFEKQVDLPIVDSRSIQLKADQYANLIWTWKVPVELGYLSLEARTQARASIEIYHDQQNTGYFSIILPVHMGYVLIPQDVVDVLDQKGNRFELIVSLETRDKNNRTYSKPFAVEGPLSRAAKFSASESSSAE